jgi:putative membrane-bound dehydrogenase-like protein
MKPRSLPVVAAILSCVFLGGLLSSAAASDGLDPAEALKLFHLADDLKIELIASEPDVVDPVAIAWDEFGRMFVVEMRDYPNGPADGQPFLSRVKLLEDTDGDGKYEKVSVFAEELPFANGVLPWQGGVIVTAAPDIWFLKDTDNDGRADVKEKLFTGFKEGNPQLRVNHPTLGIDNWIYVANGLSGGEVSRADKEDSAKIPIPQMDFRFRPDRSEFEATAGNSQFGLAFDDYGNRFMCSNRQHVAHVVLPDRYLKRNPFLAVPKIVHDIPDHGAAARIFPLAVTRTTAVEHAGTFTAACGLVIYRGTALPEKYRGNSFVCDPTGYLVHRDVLVPNGATFVAKRAPEEPRREFLASTDEWFRPVNLANGPDGALYVVDMYRANIEHPQYMPKGLAETLDLRKGDDKGRIYRIARAASEQFHRPTRWPGEMHTLELIQTLGHPDSWWRETTQRLLVDRQDKKVMGPLSSIGPRSKETTAQLHTLWTLDALDAFYSRNTLSSPDPIVRVHALRQSEPHFRRIGGRQVQNKLRSLAEDPDPRVRFQTALSVGELPPSERVLPLARVVERDVEDPWTQIAVLSSANGVAGELWRALDRGFTADPTAAKAAFVGKLASVIGARREPAEVELFLRSFADRHDSADTWWQLAAITGLADGLRPSGKKLQDLFAGLSDDAKPAVARIEQRLAESAAIARDRGRSAAERTSAIRIIGNAPLAESADLFRDLLEVAQPQEVQLAAVHVAAAVNDPGVGPLLLGGWAGHSPPVRRAVIDAMFARIERIEQLLDAIEAGTLKAADLDLNRHQQLLNHSVKGIKERASKLFENEGTPNRKEVIESYRTILTQTGDVSRGREVFMKNCATCHQIQGEGHRVGPELTGLRTRNKEALLMDVLDPNRALEPNYASYLVATKDGRVLSGIIATETANSITLRRAEGIEDTLLRQDIEAIRAAGQSLMPEGLERQVGQAEMVDLIEYLKSVP